MAKEDVDEPSLPLPMEHQLQYGAKRKGKWCVLQHAWIVLHKLSHDVCISCRTTSARHYRQRCLSIMTEYYLTFCDVMCYLDRRSFG
jgi:hypothetical protein